MRRLATFTTALILASGAAISTAGPALAGSETATPAAHVSVTLNEMSVVLSTDSVPAGPVIFDITNKGGAEHEFVILKTAIAEDALPPSADEPGKAAEIGHVDEVDPVLPGATATLAVTLTPGHYVLLCNKPGHYAAGMHASLTVTSPIAATLREMSIVLGRSFATRGSVTFAVTNDGTVVHEFVILKTDIAEGALPASADEPGKAEEVGHVAEIEGIDPGTTKELTVTLEPGKYVLICNEPGHYAGGMHASFTILPSLPTGVIAAIEAERAGEGIEDLSDEDALVNVNALVKAPGVVVTDLDRAAIADGIVPRAVASDGSLIY